MHIHLKPKTPSPSLIPPDLPRQTAKQHHVHRHNPHPQPGHVHHERILDHVEALQKLGHLAKVAKRFRTPQILPPKPIDGLHGALEAVPKVAHVRERHQKVEHLPEAHEKAAKHQHRDERAGHAEHAELESGKETLKFV